MSIVRLYTVVTWSILGGYHSLPTTVAKAEAAGYEFMIHDAYVKADLYSYPNDPRLAILFDSYGNIGGLRTGVSQFRHYSTVEILGKTGD